ncbi:TonB-dependent receptor plug domain-containing protein, partial [Pseudomonas aeruginosa]|uniref:TonB-dependent receptor plug domain-containing protein n=1 Tax=Pseudomonas aeruginosa TaxID=287 RepID=UPI003D7691AF
MQFQRAIGGCRHQGVAAIAALLQLQAAAQQQARSVADLLQANDPSVRVVGGRGDLVDSYTIRGFSVQNA